MRIWQGWHAASTLLMSHTWTTFSRIKSDKSVPWTSHKICTAHCLMMSLMKVWSPASQRHKNQYNLWGWTYWTKLSNLPGLNEQKERNKLDDQWYHLNDHGSSQAVGNWVKTHQIPVLRVEITQVPHQYSGDHQVWPLCFYHFKVVFHGS